ncbi:MAG: carboxypeptidase regulatory-like domain-containing protein [Pirellulales bacterium]
MLRSTYISCRKGIATLFAAAMLSVAEGATQPAIVPPSVISGRVLDASTREPIAGATVYATSDTNRQKTTDSQGRFRFDEAETKAIFAKAETDKLIRGVEVLAVADGFGIDFIQLRKGSTPSKDDLSEAAARDITLRLPNDGAPISGRLVDPEGKPIIGAVVEIGQVLVMPNEDLAAWFESWQKSKRRHWSSLVSHHVDKRYAPLRRRWNFSHRPTASSDVPAHFSAKSEPGLTARVVTDAEGQFAIKGVGRERIVWLMAKHPDFVYTDIFVATRPNLSVKAVDPGLPSHHGATFVQSLERATPIQGTVREHNTAKPLAGVKVFAGAHAATTAEDGSFALEGLASDERLVKFVPSPNQPHLVRELRVDEAQKQGALRVDCELFRGARVNGKVLVKATGQPIQGAVVSYMAAPGNPHPKRAVGFTTAVRHSAIDPFLTASDGSFSIAVPPGPGVICIRNWYGGADQFQPCKASEFKAAFENGRSYETADGRRIYELSDGRRIDIGQFHGIAKINPTDVDDQQEIEIRLKPASDAQPGAIK